MAKYTSVLPQLLRHIPRDEFRAIVGAPPRRQGGPEVVVLGAVRGPFFRVVNRTA